MNNSKGHYTKLMRYKQKTVGVNYRDSTLAVPAPGKTYAPNAVLQDVASALLLGKKSTREITKHHFEMRSRLGYSKALCRSTIGTLLDEERVAEKLTKDLLQIFTRAHRLRILETYPYSGRIVALIDGIDLGQVHEDGGHCDLCLERWHEGKVSYFHRLVVLSVVTKHGAFPIYFRFCKMNEIAVNPLKVSAEKFKAEGELTCAKEMLVDLAGRFNGRLPFDVIASDALMANAPFMQLVEALGAAGIFIFKQENRKLYKQAKSDFSRNSFGFNLSNHCWSEDPARKKRNFDSMWSQYVDVNRKGENKSVKIFETTRTEIGGKSSKTMAITSDRRFITPELVEIARYEKWRNLENGVFNELTNNWGTLKHIFFHKPNAMKSMIALLFICLIASILYRYRNLTRGGRRFQGTLRDFFDHMRSTFFSIRPKTLIALRCNSP